MQRMTQPEWVLWRSSSFQFTEIHILVVPAACSAFCNWGLWRLWRSIRHPKMTILMRKHEETDDSSSIHIWGTICLRQTFNCWSVKNVKTFNCRIGQTDIDICPIYSSKQGNPFLRSYQVLNTSQRNPWWNVTRIYSEKMGCQKLKVSDINSVDLPWFN